MDIHKAGGGIGFTVKNVHQSSEEELYQSLKQVSTVWIVYGISIQDLPSHKGYVLTLDSVFLIFT